MVECECDCGTMAPSLKVDASKKDPSPAPAAPLTIPCRDALATLRHDRELKRALLGIPFPVIFFCLFVAMLAQHIPTSVLYEQASSVSSVLDSSGTDAINSDTTMKFENIGTIGDVFDWLTDTFVPSVFVTEDYNGDALTKDKWGRIANFNKVLGAVIFEVTRAAVHKCSAAQFLIDLYPNCYDPASTETNTTLITFDTNSTTATAIINKLKKKGTWLDFSTQQLVITVVAYNGELQGYTVSKLTLDFHQGGYIETSAETTPTISDPYKKNAALAWDIVVAVCLLIALLKPLIQFINWLRIPGTSQKRASLQEWDAVSTLFGLAPCVMVIVFYAIWYSLMRLMYAREFRDNLARLVVSGKNFDDSSDEREGLFAVTYSLEEVANITIALRLISMGAVVTLGLDILSQFRFHPRLNILTRTVAHALHQFAAFFVVFVVIFVTFSVSGTLLFGDRVEQFSSLSKTMQSCVNMLFGNFDYSTIQDQQAPVGMLYYWAYMVIVSLVLLNMMLAIVLDSYAEMTEQAAHSRYNISLTRTIGNVRFDWQSSALAKTRATKLNKMQRLDPHGGIIFDGRIVPSVLERTLREKVEGKSLITESTLVELFPEAKLTREHARSTIQFLLDGWNATSADEEGEEEALKPACDVPAEEKEVEREAVDKEETADEEAPVVPLDAVVPVAPVASTVVPASADEVARVLARMEVLETKLDLLLARTVTEPH